VADVIKPARDKTIGNKRNRCCSLRGTAWGV